MPTVFISHAATDEALASALKDLIEAEFIGYFEAFVSSDSRSLPAGTGWLDMINKNINDAEEFIVLLTPYSVQRQWVLFEAGAAFGKGVGFIPVCAKGLTVSHVGPPLNTAQIVTINTGSDIDKIVTRLAQQKEPKLKLTPKANPLKRKRVLELALPKDDDLPPPLPYDVKLRESMVKADVQQEWDRLGRARQVFWESLEEYYRKAYQGREHYPPTIAALVDQAEPPLGLPLAEDRRLLDYPTKYGLSLAGPSGNLYKYCKDVYPTKDLTKDLIDCSAISRSRFQEFHIDARKELAGFFQRWAQKAYSGNGIELKTLVDMLQLQSHRLTKILSYLEICLVQWTQDTGVGKQWLFRLCRDWPRVK